MWKETTKHPRNARLFEEELDEFLPEKIFDMHVHCFDESIPPQEITMMGAGGPIPRYTVDELAVDLGELYPGRETGALCFGTPQMETDHQANNRYILSACDGKRFLPSRLLRPGDDPRELDREFSEHPWIGVKPYLRYVENKETADIEIRDMLPPRLMDVVDAHGRIVTLHIPRSGRLADPVNQEQLVEYAERWPKARFVIAHVGRAYYYKNVVDQLDALRPFDNVYFDTAMVVNREVLEYTFLTIQPHKLLYGTDIPIAVAPGTSVEINDQYTYITPKASRLSIGDDHGKLVFTSFVYEELRSIKWAVERCRLPRAWVEDFFWNNAADLVADVTGSDS